MLNKYGRMVRLIMLVAFVFTLVAMTPSVHAQDEDPLAQFVPAEATRPKEVLKSDDETIGFVLTKPFQRRLEVVVKIPNLDKYPVDQEITCWMAIGNARFHTAKDKQAYVQSDGTVGNVVVFNGKHEFHVHKKSYSAGNGTITCLFGMNVDEVENDVLASMAHMATDDKGCGREGCLTVNRYVEGTDNVFSPNFTLKREDAQSMIDSHGDFQPPQMIHQCWEKAQIDDSLLFPVVLTVPEGGATRVYLTGELTFRSGKKIGPGWTIIMGNYPDGNTPQDLNTNHRLKSVTEGNVCWWMTYVSTKEAEEATIKADADHPSDTSVTVDAASLR